MTSSDELVSFVKGVRSGLVALFVLAALVEVGNGGYCAETQDGRVAERIATLDSFLLLLGSKEDDCCCFLFGLRFFSSTGCLFFGWSDVGQAAAHLFDPFVEIIDALLSLSVDLGLEIGDLGV